MKSARPVTGENPVLFLALMIAAYLLLPGCQMPGTRLIRDGSGPFASNNATMFSVAAEQELAEAKRMLRAGEHSRVIPRLMGITTQYAGTDAGTEAWYVLGLTYFKIDGHQDAEKYFRKYIALAPEGDYAALCRAYISGMENAATQRGTERAALEARVAKFDGIDAPEELAASLELAETYWHENEFEKASVVYTQVLQAWPTLKDDAIIRQRMELGPDGHYVVLTPAEVERRHSAAEPMTVFNVQTFRSGRYRTDQYGYQDEYYNVTGQVVNRGEVPLFDTGLNVTIFGLAGQVYDTLTVQFGQLRPGEVRAFSVRFNNFDNIANVHRYECTVFYSH